MSSDHEKEQDANKQAQHWCQPSPWLCGATAMAALSRTVSWGRRSKPRNEDGAERQKQGKKHEGQVASSFEELGISTELAERASVAGAAQPTRVQAEAIPNILNGESVALRSAPGTGKTLAFTLPTLELMGRDWNSVAGIYAVIVVPSRELAAQVTRECRSILGEGAEPLVGLCAGGANKARQQEKLRKRRPPIVVGTPGRIADLSRGGFLQSHMARILVLDEADALLLEEGVSEDLTRIVTHTGKKHASPQVVLAGAGLPKEAVETCEHWFGKEPIEVDGERATNLPGCVEHFSLPVQKEWRRTEEARKAIHAANATSCLAFVNGQGRARDVAGKLDSNSLPCESLHGQQSDQERKASIDRFRIGKIRVLVATEVAARGLDVPECDAVFNIDLPRSATSYALRAGRTGRFGRYGRVFSLCSKRRGEERLVGKIARELGVSVESLSPSHGRLVFS